MYEQLFYLFHAYCIRQRHCPVDCCPRLIYLLMLFFLSVTSYGQNEAKKTAASDTLKIDTFSMNSDFLFYLSHKQLNKYVDIRFVNSAKANYVDKYTDYGLYFRQILDRLYNGYLYSNHYLNLSVGLGKYKPTRKEHFYGRIYYPELIFIFQNNSARGLQKRFQTGFFFYPVRYYTHKIKIGVGLGCLYDWSSWEVNDPDKINAAPPEWIDMIYFVNSHSKLRKNMYMDFSEFRPTLFLSVDYQSNDYLNFNVFLSHQQSLVSPFNDEIKAAYPVLKKIYPYHLSQWSVTAKVYKGLGVKSTFILDYENNNLSMYDSSWEYSILFGVTWSFAK